MAETQEQIAADAALRDAIIQHSIAYGLYEDGELLDQYAVISAWQPAAETGQHNYLTAFHTNTVPQHVAIGLFTLGVELVLEQKDEE